MPRGKVRAEEIAALRASGAFDGEWYCKAYPDVELSGIDPAEHFLWIGAKLGRSPLPPPAVTVQLGSTTQTLESARPPDKALKAPAKKSRPRARLDLGAEQANHFDITDVQFWSIAPQLYNSAELSVAELFGLYSALRYTIRANIKGDVIECGAHVGGAIAGFAEVIGAGTTDRRFLALDTSTGSLSRSKSLELEMRSDTEAPPDKEPSDIEQSLKQILEPVQTKSSTGEKRGRAKTLRALDWNEIAILRLRTEAYDTTKSALERLYDKVVIGGIVIIEDYGYAAGSRKAVDEFVRGTKVLLQRTAPNGRSWVKVFK